MERRENREKKRIEWREQEERRKMSPSKTQIVDLPLLLHYMHYRICVSITDIVVKKDGHIYNFKT